MHKATPKKNISSPYTPKTPKKVMHVEAILRNGRTIEAEEVKRLFDLGYEEANSFTIKTSHSEAHPNEEYAVDRDGKFMTWIADGKAKKAWKPKQPARNLTIDEAAMLEPFGYEAMYREFKVKVSTADESKGKEYVVNEEGVWETWLQDPTPKKVQMRDLWLKLNSLEERVCVLKEKK